MSGTYISAMGKKVDMAALRARNEKVRAVGNMNVNARGDVIDSNDQIIEDGTKRVNEFYMKSVMNRGIKPTGVDTAPAPESGAQQQSVAESQHAAVKMPQIDPVIEPFEQIQLTAEESEFDQQDEEIVKNDSKTAKYNRPGSSK